MTHRVINSAGAFEISTLPGQCQVAVCHSFFVHEHSRKRGNGHVLKALQNKTLQAMHYDFAVCTVAQANAAQRSILEQAGWQRLTEFRNHRSSEITELWGRAL